MATTWMHSVLATVAVLWVAAQASADPTVAQMLSFRPQQEGVVCGMPTAEEQRDCKVKLETGKQRGSSGWLLVDGKGQTLRRFFDHDGDKQIDLWSYYKDGIEVYREMDTKKARKPDQFRWLNSGGSKWGIDINADGKIDSWKMISAEEAAHEAHLAIATRDLARLRALLITDAEINSLKLSAAQAKRLRDALAGVQAKFGDTIKKLPQLDARAHFVRVESGPPHCVPADANSSDQDLIQYATRSILFEHGDKDKKHDWLHTGPMVLVGQNWRLVDSPMPGDGSESSIDPKIDKIADSDPELRKLLDALSKHDEKPPAGGDKTTTIRYNLTRADLCRQIADKAKKEDRETWLKQAADSLNSAAQHSGLADRTALKQLTALREQAVRSAPGSNLAAYIAYRELWADLGPQIDGSGDRKKIAEAHEKLDERLTEFVKLYPKTDDTPDAMWQLAMNAEVNGREDEAKRWYKLIVDNFAQHPLAARATGAIRRLNLVGQPLELSGPTLAGTQFNLSSLKGKLVVVYYWATYGEPAADFKILNKLRDDHKKDLELVTVNLDETAADAQRFLQKSPMPVPHLFQATKEESGLNSPLAAHYGIQGIPSLFLVGRDGRVLNRTLQINDLESEISKALKTQK